MPTALVGGAARQRRRTGDGHGHVRVLKGYLKRGILKGYSNATLKKGSAKRVLERGFSNASTQKGVLKKGHSTTGLQRDTQKGMKRSGETASGARGRLCAVYGGQCTPEQWPVWYGRMYRVLTAYSHDWSSHRRLRLAYCCASLASTRAWAATEGYSQGTHRVLPRYCATLPSRRHSFVCLSQCDTTAVHGSVGHPSV
jgi:hypothetical protein